MLSTRFLARFEISTSPIASQMLHTFSSWDLSSRQNVLNLLIIDISTCGHGLELNRLNLYRFPGSPSRHPPLTGVILLFERLRWCFCVHLCAVFASVRWIHSSPGRRTSSVVFFDMFSKPSSAVPASSRFDQAMIFFNTSPSAAQQSYSHSEGAGLCLERSSSKGIVVPRPSFAEGTPCRRLFPR